MDTRTHEAARTRLIRVQRELLERRGHDLEEVARLLSSENVDPIDIATFRREAGLLERFSDLELRELRDTDLALRRLEAGSYERCMACGGLIEPERLAAMPTATQCSACAGVARLDL